MENSSGMEKMIGAFEARRQFGRILNEVSGQGDRFVVERHGEPVAAVVPIKVYRQWKLQRAAFFDHMRATAERANLSPEEAAALVDEAIRAVHGQPQWRCRKVFVQSPRRVRSSLSPEQGSGQAKMATGIT
jgi:prevent-host-death family protein